MRQPTLRPKAERGPGDPMAPGMAPAADHLAIARQLIADADSLLATAYDYLRQAGAERDAAAVIGARGFLVSTGAVLP